MISAAGPAPPMTLTPEQEAAVGHPRTAQLIVAGAGTGKTTVMAARMAHLAHIGAVQPDELLALTFTNKAARELKERVLGVLGPDTDVTVATYHGFAAGLVADHALALDLHPRTQLLNRAQAWQLLFAVFDEFRFERRRTTVPGLIVRDALVLADRCADHLVDIASVEADCDAVIQGAPWKTAQAAAAGRRELCQVVAAYQRRKRQRHLIDHGDQIRFAVQLLSENTGVATALRARFPVVLLDEYQDTNYAQRVLLQLIYPPGSAITAVGDDMQSIYAFRGAHIENILRFEEHFPPATRRPLTANRRSGPSVVHLANRIQAQVPGALEKELRPLNSAPPSSIECFLASDHRAEAEQIAADVVALGTPWSDHAVLCRKRRLIQPVVEAMEEAGVPVEVVGLSGLLERPEIVDVLAWLEVLVQGGDAVAALRILRGPRYRIGLSDLAAVARHSGGIAGLAAGTDVHDVPDLSDEARARLAEYQAERSALVEAARRLPVPELVEAVIERTGLWLVAGVKGRENLLRLLDFAHLFRPIEEEPGLPAFVAYLQMLDDVEEDVPEAHLAGIDAVRVLTIHQAKGLEFTNVWVPGLAGSGSSRIFPDGRSGENALSQQAALPWWLRAEDEGLPAWPDVKKLSAVEDELRRRRLEEEWRLLYVACTRARCRLVCSAAHWYPGPASPQGPSLFYDFIASQADLVTERYRSDPAETDPRVADLERRRAASTAPSPAPQPVLGTAAPVGRSGERATAAPRPVPAALSVTSLVTHARCPLAFWWTTVRPLPRATSPAARLGTDIHQWIESGAPMAESGEDPGSGTGTGPQVTFGLRDSYRDSPYVDRTPTRVEAPFHLVIEGRLVQGRIDAVYESDDGSVELVDFKTGLAPEDGDPSAWTQLELYALAAVETWGVDPARLRTTYCYLRSDGPSRQVTRAWDSHGIVDVRRRLAKRLHTMAGPTAAFPPNPGPWCARCDFLVYCPEGGGAVGHEDADPG